MIGGCYWGEKIAASHWNEWVSSFQNAHDFLIWPRRPKSRDINIKLRVSYRHQNLKVVYRFLRDEGLRTHISLHCNKTTVIDWLLHPIFSPLLYGKDLMLCHAKCIL